MLRLQRATLKLSWLGCDSMIKLEGAEELFERFEKIASGENFLQGLNKACALVETEAKKKAPKDTGELRRSITSEVYEKGETYEGAVYTPLEYAPYIEYGTGLFAENGGRMDVPWHYKDDKGEWHSTSGQHPQPFLRPALDENREAILRLLKGGILNE